MKKSKSKASDLLIRRGICESPEMASALILAGQVVAEIGTRQWRVEKPGDLLEDQVALRLKGQSQFVSRGGDKLLRAIARLHVREDIAGKRVLDAGASTGGFTDCVLSLGAKEVYAVDVGTNQLAWKLRQDPRVKSFEGLHIKDAAALNWGTFDWILADISFNSLTRLLPSILPFAHQGTRFLLLVKPQFELRREDIPSGGVVIDPASRKKATQSVAEGMASCGITVLDSFDSEVEGRSGNIEIFVYGRRN